MIQRKFKPKEKCKAEKHDLGIVKIADGWVCYFCGTKVSSAMYVPGATNFESKKPYIECHCYCYQPLTNAQEKANEEKWMDEKIGDEFLDPRIAEPEDGWKFRYKRNIARTCPICFEDLNWWGEEGSENLVCSNVACGLDESVNEINHHLWRERFVKLLNQQAIEALDKVKQAIVDKGVFIDKDGNKLDITFPIINNIQIEYSKRERINEDNKKTPRQLGLRPVGSGTIKRSKINPKLLEELEK